MERLSYLYELIECCHPIEHWMYSEDGHLMGSNSANERILDVIFSAGDIKKYMMEYGKTNTKPLILSSSLGNLWIAVFDNQPDSNIYYHVLGPVFIDAISPQLLQQRASEYDNLPLHWKRSFMRIVQEFPLVPWQTLTQYTIMLHYAVNREHITVSDFSYQNTTFSRDVSKSNPQKEVQTSQEKRENLPYHAEQELFNHIRNGTLDYQSALSKASTVSSGIKIDIGDSLRRAKNSGIVFAALAARAAIEGGLPSEVAYAVQNQYSQSIEACSNLSEVAGINHQMYDDFIHRVHKVKELSNVSPQIRACISYIEMHLTEKLTLTELADMVGYTEYYLSRKFKSETGTSINEFLKNSRITHAKNLLKTTDLSIQEISEQLNFCSRSYFADTFHKTVGISPTEYREKYMQL